LAALAKLSDLHELSLRILDLEHGFFVLLDLRFLSGFLGFLFSHTKWKRTKKTTASLLAV